MCWVKGQGPQDQEFPHNLPTRTSTMSEFTACATRCHDDYCDRRDVLVGLPGLHVIGAYRHPGGAGHGRVSADRDGVPIVRCRG